jgi:hypothetical protein
VDADAAEGQHRAGEREQREGDQRHAAREHEGGTARAGGRRRFEARQPLRADVRLQVGGTRARADRGALHDALRRRRRDRVLVGFEHLLRDVRPGEALGAHGGGAAHRDASGRREPQVAQRLRERGRVAARHEHRVDAVAHHVAVAGDVRGHDGRAGREALRQHHPEALAAERRGDQQVSRFEHAPLLGVVDTAEHRHAAIVEQQRLDLVAIGADDRQLRRDVLAQRLERAQQHRQPLALDGLPDERQPQWPVGVGDTRGALLGHDDAVGDDPIAAAEEALRGPRSGLGDGDALVQVVEAAARAEQAGDVVRQPVRRVAVERADERQPRRRHRVPAQQRRDRLVQVDDVEAAVAQLAPHVEHAARPRGEVGDRPVGLEADRAAERDHVVRQRARLRRRAAVQCRREAVVGVVRGQHADVVPLGEEALCQGLDVPSDAAGVGPRVRRDQGYAHTREILAWNAEGSREFRVIRMDGRMIAA